MKETRIGKADGNKPGLYENIRKKRERIAAGSGEKMKKPGQKGAPSASDFKQAAKTAKPEEKKDMGMKKGCDCTDGTKGKCSCGKKDGGMKKSPYADGCGYMKDSVAADFNAVLDSMGVEKISKGEEEPDDDRDDKKCGASGIADNKKCNKGTGAAPKGKDSDVKAQAQAKAAEINKPNKGKKMGAGKRALSTYLATMAAASGISNAVQAGEALSKGQYGKAVSQGAMAAGNLTGANAFASGNIGRGFKRQTLGNAAGLAGYVGGEAAKGYKRANNGSVPPLKDLYWRARERASGIRRMPRNA
jgi:hypothetical protein